MLAGGHKQVSAEADAIIAAAVRAEPERELLAWLRNGLAQLGHFTSGDELHACPMTVTPWIDADFPRFERAVYAAARQTKDRLAVPPWMQALHRSRRAGGYRRLRHRADRRVAPPPCRRGLRRRRAAVRAGECLHRGRVFDPTRPLWQPADAAGAVVAVLGERCSQCRQRNATTGRAYRMPARSKIPRGGCDLARLPVVPDNPGDAPRRRPRSRPPGA